MSCSGHVETEIIEAMGKEISAYIICSRLSNQSSLLFQQPVRPFRQRGSEDFVRYFYFFTFELGYIQLA